MLRHTHAFSSFSVKDLDAAAAFYESVLGLNVRRSPEGGLEIELTGGATVFAYPKDNHEAASFTVLNFSVDDIDAAVRELEESGVTMLRYDGFDQDEKGVARNPGHSIAWFADPSDNVISIIQEG